jgi:homoserine dehydrogenase
MSQPLRLGIAGLGTVGIGTVKIIQRHRELLARRTGRGIELVAISARDRRKNRDADLSAYAWEDDPVRLATRKDIDVFVELMGGADGAALAATRAAIATGKDVVTANKAMLAHHGHALAAEAEAKGHVIRFEAAVAGGIPVVKALTEGLAGNEIRRVMGVMNGTCNYILTRMESAGLAYAEVFEEARQLGYLEADPNLDVGGIDAGHKLSLLAAIAFGTKVSFDAVELEGIGRISTCLVPAESPLGQLQGGTNMVVLEGDSVGQIVLRGPGAGEGPTASAVMSDVVEIARGCRISTFGQPASTLADPVAAKAAAPAPHYLRMELADKPGALAKVATVLGEEGVSIDRMRQYGHADTTAPVLIVTHRTTRAAIDHAVGRLPATGVVVGDPVAIRIESA